MHAAEARAHEFAPRGAGDALAERGLADARRTDEAEDRAAAVGAQLADGEIFEYPPLHLFQAEMVFVENPTGLRHVDLFLRGYRPGWRTTENTSELHSHMRN